MTTAAQTVVAHLDAAAQRELVASVRDVIKASPLVRPRTPGGAPMRVRVTSAGALGWVGDGAYRYDPVDTHGRPWPAIPQLWLDIANDNGGAHPYDSAIVNWYDPGAALGWHRDQAEHDKTLPIVTISLGDAASWAVRAHEKAGITRCTLQSGAVTLLAGPTRGYLHTVERIIAEPLLSPLPKRGRVSITLRVAGAPGGKTSTPRQRGDDRRGAATPTSARGAQGGTADQVPRSLTCCGCGEPMPGAADGELHWTTPTTGPWRGTTISCGVARVPSPPTKRQVRRARRRRLEELCRRHP